MTTTETSPDDLTFTPVASIPSITRTPGEGRDPIKWEDKLAPLKSKQGEAFVTWTYEKKSAATSRVAAIRNRLFSATPSDNWTLAVRTVPGSDPETYGVYVQFNGTFTDEEVAKNAKDRADRSERIRAARQAADAAGEAIGAEAPVAEAPAAPAAPETPAQKVAAAKKAQAAGK